MGVYLNGCLATMNMPGILRDQKRAHILQNWSHRQLKSPYGCWELNLVPLQEQQVPLGTELSLPFAHYLKPSQSCPLESPDKTVCAVTTDLSSSLQEEVLSPV